MVIGHICSQLPVIFCSLLSCTLITYANVVFFFSPPSYLVHVGEEDKVAKYHRGCADVEEVLQKETSARSAGQGSAGDFRSSMSERQQENSILANFKL